MDGLLTELGYSKYACYMGGVFAAAQHKCLTTSVYRLTI